MSSPSDPGSDSDYDSDSGSSSGSGSEVDMRPPSPRPCENKNYYDLTCERCRELERIEPVIEDGDEERYLFECERVGDGEFGDDEGIKQRVIMYRKSLAKSGGFDADCPPYYLTRNVFLFARQHFDDWDIFDIKVHEAVEHVIDTYNREKGKSLKYGKTLNVTASQYMLFTLYITFECFNPPEDPSFEKYQAVVSCDMIDNSVDDKKKILIFRKESTGMDLLDPHEPTARCIAIWKAKARVGDGGGKRKFEGDEGVEG
ncbi:unnamed protein product [Linum tenue]|uniref:Cystatin domain-containing protein n=1 Tax=Linum tenue TaxID=586396 RepID=A0AAV0NCV6_9ROSI|nr:unnamed protein product [Linum tenue]